MPFTDRGNCGAYNTWPYGLLHRTGYTARLTDDQLKSQLTARHITYLLGGLDILPIEGFDGSCPAMAQGPTRFARGFAYAQYLNAEFAAKDKVVIIPTCGHDSRCMFTSEQTLAIIFPE